MTLGDIISGYRQEHGMSMDKFSKASGISKAYISMLEKNRTQRGEEPAPSIEMYRNVAHAIGVSVDELVRMVDGKVTLTTPLPSNVQPMPAMHQVPRLGTIACGDPLLAQQNIEGYDSVPDYVKCDFTLVCRGDSMINARIFDGDIVCIREQPEVENGEIAAVLINSEEATLKRVRLFDDHIVLEPENPMYKPFVFWGEEMNNVRILGKATHFISALK